VAILGAVSHNDEIWREYADLGHPRPFLIFVKKITWVIRPLGATFYKKIQKFYKFQLLKHTFLYL